MADWTVVGQLLGTGVVGGLGTWFWARQKNASTTSVERRHRAADSDLDHNQKNSRQLYEDRVSEIAQLKAELSMRGHEVIDLMNQRYELGMKVAALEAEKFVMLKGHAKAAVAFIAERPGVDVKETMMNSQFSDLTPD